MKQKVLIVTGGSLEKELLKIYLQKEYDYLIAADKGMLAFEGMERQPDYILGDFDSAEKEAVEFYKRTGIEMQIYPKEKDETDTHLAILKGVEVGADFITILGGLGTRFDHSFANIALLSLLLEQNIDAEIVDTHNRISMLAGGNTKRIKKSEQYGDYVSLIPYTEMAKAITLTGFAYPLCEYTMRQGISIGISNEIVEEQGEIFLEEGILLIVESKD